MLDRQTFNPHEVQKFAAMADDWWNHKSTKMLHLMNIPRLSYIYDHINQHFDLNKTGQSLQLMDVGCGGGILTEPLARKLTPSGFSIYGIDAVAQNIANAQQRAQSQQLTINYQHAHVEDLSQYKQQFHVLSVLEVIEHVNNPQFFIQSCMDLLAPGGLLFFSTINRNVKSFIQAIAIAEYALRLLDTGTHDWRKFVTPAQFNRYIEKASGKIINLSGIKYNLLKNECYLCANIDVNYIGCAIKSPT